MHYAVTGFMHKMAGMTMVPSLVYALQEFMHYYVMHYEHIDCSLKYQWSQYMGLAGMWKQYDPRLVEHNKTQKVRKCKKSL